LRFIRSAGWRKNQAAGIDPGDGNQRMRGTAKDGSISRPAGSYASKRHYFSTRDLVIKEKEEQYS
jgi:hypothetical protein